MSAAGRASRLASTGAPGPGLGGVARAVRGRGEGPDSVCLSRGIRVWPLRRGSRESRRGWRASGEPTGAAGGPWPSCPRVRRSQFPRRDQSEMARLSDVASAGAVGTIGVRAGGLGRRRRVRGALVLPRPDAPPPARRGTIGGRDAPRTRMSPRPLSAHPRLFLTLRFGASGCFVCSSSQLPPNDLADGPSRKCSRSVTPKNPPLGGT